MKCTICKKRTGTIKFEFIPETFCNQCFINFFESKVLRTIRKQGKITKYDKIIIVRKYDLCTTVALYLMKKYFIKSKKLLIVNSIKQAKEVLNKKSIIISTKPLEYFATLFFNEFVYNHTYKKEDKLNIFYNTSVKEIEKYYELVFGKKRQINIKIKNYKYLLKLQQRYPHLFFALLRSKEKIYENLK